MASPLGVGKGTILKPRARQTNPENGTGRDSSWNGGVGTTAQTGYNGRSCIALCKETCVSPATNDWRVHGTLAGIPFRCPPALVPNWYSPASGPNNDRHVRLPPLAMRSNRIGQVLSGGNNGLVSYVACLPAGMIPSVALRRTRA